MLAACARLAGEAAEALLDDARGAAGRAGATTRRRAGPAPRTVVDRTPPPDADVLVLARDGRHPGPHSLGHATRFVVDHAPCTVLLAWP